MENITITNFQQLLVTLVSIIGSLIVLARYIKTWLGADIKELDKQQTMDFLIMEFARAERHPLGEAEKVHVKKRYDHYITPKEKGGLDGNSYIREEYERLVKEGKL